MATTMVAAKKPVKTWQGGTTCDMCHQQIVRHLYDAKTGMGPWATMCQLCYGACGVGLGTGRGQHYQFDGRSGTWIKVAG
jgi:hypothetical protein